MWRTWYEAIDSLKSEEARNRSRMSSASRVVGVQAHVGQEGGEGEAAHVGDVHALLHLREEVHHAWGHVVEGELAVRLLLYGLSEPLQALHHHVDVRGQLLQDGIVHLQGELVLDALAQRLLEEAGELALGQVHVAVPQVLVVQLPRLVADGAGVLQVVGEVHANGLPAVLLHQLCREGELLLRQLQQELGVLAKQVGVGRLGLLEGVAAHQQHVPHRGHEHAGDGV